MSNFMDTVKEFINPNWGHHRTVPPMDAGLRANTRIDGARELLADRTLRPDDVDRAEDGSIVFSAGDAIYRLAGGKATKLVDLGARVNALSVDGSALIAAVSGRGIVSVDGGGTVTEICTDDIVSHSITDIAATGDGRMFVTVGSRTLGGDQWANALLTDDRTGALVEVNGATTRIVQEGLAWPSGVAMRTNGGILLAQSLAHKVEARDPGALGHEGVPVAENLPLFPGRMAIDGGDVWIAAPYIRNRVTELLLDEPEFVGEMMATVPPGEWFVPRLYVENPMTDTLQMGQLRTEGEIKSWAPARSCGIAFRVDGLSGRVVDSLHARVDSPRHGITGITAHDGVVVLAAQGYGNLLQLDANSDDNEKDTRS
ncbi:hypothetical protein [Gordonia sp. (in: high G+C Gram-positive bacteria)]|uniref:hypothetical protein n=1 Tax=Gordonia sp. (in: high G+C Gram-positive bacteria) TaxID=84139 RepID=UPI0039E4E71C